MSYYKDRSLNVMHWKKMKVALVIFTAWVIIFYIFIIPMHFLTATPDEHHIQTQPKDVPHNFSSLRDVIEYKNRRWKALINLDGSMFKQTENLECESMWSREFRNNFNQQLPEEAFVGSELYSFPRHVDLPKKLCLFKQGHRIYDNSFKDRNFEPLITQPLLCGNGTENTVDLLILVKSAFDNLQRRVTIRNLWGNTACWAGRTVRTVFLLGLSNQRNVSKSSQLWMEIVQYGDIIQQNFDDHYYNNTYKLLFGLQWSIAYCPEAKWLAFFDDDFFINSRQVLSFLESVDPRLQTRLVFGDISIKSEVPRENSKWSVNTSIFPHPNYPNFLPAGAFFMGTSIALDIYVGSRFTKFFPFDDVFLGIVMNKLLIAPAHIQGFLTQEWMFNLNPRINETTALHGVRTSLRQQQLWHMAKLQSMCVFDQTQ